MHYPIQYKTATPAKGAQQKVLACLLATALATTMVPVTASTEAYAGDGAADNVAAAETTADELLVVYEGDALQIDEDAAPEDSSTEITLQDAGVEEQTEAIDAAGIDGDVTVVTLADNADADTAMKQIEDLPGVKSVQPNYEYSILSTTSDPYNGADVSAAQNQYYLYQSNIADAWDHAKSDGRVSIAVLDTGCNLNHPDLAGTVDAGLAYDVTADAPLAGLGLANGGDPMGHGTPVAGVIAAQADNGVGIAGASYNANIIPVKVFDANNTCTTADMIAAYGYLKGLLDTGKAPNLKAVNISLGYYASAPSEEDKALRDAIAELRDQHGVLTICAGGNGDAAGNPRTGTLLPSDFDECLSVAALNEQGAIATFSDNNAAKDISAPGVGILSTAANGGYAKSTGSSLAAPVVTGAAALLWAADPSLSANQVVAALEQNAGEPTGNARPGNGANRTLDALAALDSVVDADLQEADDAAAPEQDGSFEEGLPENANENAVMGSSAEQAAQDTPGTDTDEGEVVPLSSEENGLENSWRYENGTLLDSADIDTDGGGLKVFSIVKDGLYNVFNWYDAVGGLCPSAGASRGIDVSEHNKSIDWAAAKAAGVNFAIIRCGYGQDYRSQDDKYWVQNVRGCVQNKIPFGIYLYSYAKNATMAAGEAQHVLSCLKQVNTGGYLKLPIYYDMEDANLAAQSNATLASMAKTFCNTIKNAGYDVGVYANTTWWNTRLTDSSFKSWKRWVAQYNTYGVQYQGFNKANDIWQFTSKGRVAGISGNVDLNYSHIASLPKTTLPGGSWVKSGSRWWYRYSDGSYPKSCSKVIGGQTYRFDGAGWMRTGWVKENNKWYYHNASGAMVKGWALVGRTWYYLNPSDGVMKTGWYNVGSKRYYSDGSGAMKTGWVHSGNKWYWMDGSGAMHKGWVLVGGRTWYYLNPSDGVMKTGWYNVGSKRYYSDGSGAMRTGWVKSGNNWYYMDASGAMVKGWALVGGRTWYYLNPSDGVMKTGFYDVAGKRYYSDASGAMKTGWVLTGGKWYWMDGSGAMAKNRWISGIYWVGSDGVMAKNAWVDSNRYYVNGSGVWVPGAKR